ncbi:MAG: asparagine synthase (glutamine-hydrolyzing) [Deltaproteobacteria bacterium]|jgi:asparagine synthase (glutamine-hydrolysing)|nr:asparagine synthase (glutamine-hydrolyzing) [Deltaproteobacteria bacterium]
MCGICGIIGCSDGYRVERMTKVMTHRGPDGFGTITFNTSQAALGHTRLKILDLTDRAHQPMRDPEGATWLTYNGEIYNFETIKKELANKGYSFSSKSDTEVVLYSYKEWGVNCLDRFNGMFAFAIWDDRKKLLFIARDRLGIKPVYYYHSNNLLIFASEIKSILESGLVEKRVDYFALHTPAMYQVSPLTGFKNIYKLLPGSYLTFQDGLLRIHKYWQIHPSEDNLDEDQAIEELDRLLDVSVQGQMIADVPVGAFLSGGLDSSLIVALMSRNRTKQINTFTIRYADEDQKFEQMPDDSKYAKKVAKLFDCRHHEFVIKSDITDLLPKMIWHLDEPLADPASINTYLIAKSARENGIVVLLNGMGGDEIFAGYRKQLACLLADSYQIYVPGFARHIMEKGVKRLPSATRKRGIRTIRWAKRFLSFATLPQAQRYFVSGMIKPEEFKALFLEDFFNKENYWHTHCVKSQLSTFKRKDISYLTKMCLNDTRVFLSDHNLTYSDKCTMAAGVESRPPLTDHRVVEFMFSLHPGLKINRITQKYLLKKVGERYLPKEIVYRPKAPFGSPLRSWIRGPLSPMIDDYLSHSLLRRRGIYNYKYVWEKIENDRQGREDNAHLIWTLLCNEIWMKTFFG